MHAEGLMVWSIKVGGAAALWLQQQPCGARQQGARARHQGERRGVHSLRPAKPPTHEGLQVSPKSAPGNMRARGI